MYAMPEEIVRDSTEPTIDLSVVIPVCNEERSLRPLLGRLLPVLRNLTPTYEVLLVDDGSNDRTWLEVVNATLRNGRIRGLRLSRNFGHQHALLAGLAYARGRAVVSMDGDLQHPPEILPALVAKWRQGFKVVVTVRDDALATAPFKRLTSHAFYRLFSRLTNVRMAAGSSDFRLIDRTVLDELLRFQDTDLFLRGAVQWLGFPCASVSFTAERRRAGHSKYGFARMIRFASGAIVSFTNKPLLLGIWLALLTGCAALLEIVYVFVQHFRGQTVAGWASIVVLLSTLFAVLFFVLGVIGIYVARIHQALQQRPRFVIADSANIAGSVERVHS